jgi:tetratricopeptide (TPR) repeat protein
MRSFRSTLTALYLIAAASLGAQNRIDSLETALKTAQGEQKVKTMNELFIEYINADPIKATEYTREAMALALEIADEKGIAASYNNLGVAYRNQGALDKALENYLVALQIYQKLKNKEGIASCQNNIGNIYSIKKDQVNATKYLEQSHQLFIELNNQEKLVRSLNNLGNMYSEVQQFEQAMKYYQEAVQRSEEFKLTQADPYINIGNANLKQGKYNEAIEQLQKALPLAEKTKDKLSVLSIMTSLGDAYVKSGNIEEAQKHLKQALTLCQDLQANMYEPIINKALSITYATQGDMRKAYEYMVRYDQAREKIYSEESTRKIAQMEMALNIQEKEKEIEALKKDDAMKTLELRNTQMIVAISFLVIITVIMVLSLVWQRKKMKSL